MLLRMLHEDPPLVAADPSSCTAPPPSVTSPVRRFALPGSDRALAEHFMVHQSGRHELGLAASDWRTAVLLVQWEVARRRAGVGGASMLTAAWWPWYAFEVHARVPARAFRPAPSVDGGLLTMTRRAAPLVAERGPYQDLVQRVFTGRGRGLTEILERTGCLDRQAVRSWARDARVTPHALPKDLTAGQWASLWQEVTRRRRPGL